MTVEGWKLIYPFVAMIIILLQPHCIPPSLQQQCPNPHSLEIPSIYDVSNFLQYISSSNSFIWGLEIDLRQIDI